MQIEFNSIKICILTAIYNTCTYRYIKVFFIYDVILPTDASKNRIYKTLQELSEIRI